MLLKTVKYFYNYSNNFEDALLYSCRELKDYLIENNLTQNNILLINVFVETDNRSLIIKNEIINKYFYSEFPNLPFLIIPQSPYLSQCAIEVIFAEGDFEILKSEQKYKLIKSNNIYELYCCQNLFNPRNILRSSKEALTLIQKILKQTKFPLESIVRQWNYIENILLTKDGCQNYQAFNDARSEFYQIADWHRGYPSATGIGSSAGGVNISLFAVKEIDMGQELKIFPLRNPKQADAHKYSENVLVGKEKIPKTTPKFERGKIVITNDNFDIYVSGTAAILGENTIDKPDIKSQTITTIKNILELISKNNLKNNTAKELHTRIAGLPENTQFFYVRAYVKYKNDIPLVQEICHKYFADVPMIFLSADICRENLLVEIEGALFI